MNASYLFIFSCLILFIISKVFDFMDRKKNLSENQLDKILIFEIAFAVICFFIGIFAVHEIYVFIASSIK